MTEVSQRAKEPVTGLAVAGPAVWISYLCVDRTALVGTALGLLVSVALLGFVMLLRRVPVHRGAYPGPGAVSAGALSVPAERAFSVPAAAGNGVFAVAAGVRGPFTALGVGGN